MQVMFNGLELCNDTGRINPNAVRQIKQDPDMTTRLVDATSFLTGENISIQERIYVVVTGTTTQPTCSTCANPVRYVRDKKRYPQYCCVLCARTDPATVRARALKWLDQKDETVAKIKATKDEMSDNQKRSVAEKRHNTMVERHGGFDGMWTEERLEQRSETNKQRYGVKHASQAHCVREKISLNHARKLPYMDIDDKDTLIRLHHQEQLPLRYIAEMYNVSPSVITERFKEHGVDVINFYRSTPQLKLEQWLESLGIDVLSNDRTIISPLELDIVLPQHNIAIEINGIRWHGELNGKGRTYHLSKTEHCTKRGLRLLHFWDIEIVQKWDIVTSMIRHRLNLCERTIGARQCSVNEIPSSEAYQFCEDNHIQGGIKSATALSLQYCGQVIAVACFGPSRFERDKMELLRFCTLRNISVVGGLGRLVSNYTKSTNTGLVTYCDKRYGTGGGYEQVGFKHVHDTSPGYYYYNGSAPTLLSRHQFQKHKLGTKLERYDSLMSEWDNMQMNGYDRVWDCGHSKWYYTCS